jgi:urease accessory protein
MGEALVHLNNVSGGILGGDVLHMDVTVDPGARAQITSVSATRIYRRKPNGQPAQQASCVHVGEDSFLEYLPDAVIPFKNSAFHQTSEYHLAQGAGMIAWEILAAGRLAYAESFAFEDFTSRTAIYGPRGLLALENYSLRPGMQNLRSPARFGRYNYSATMWICRIDDNFQQWLKLEEELNELAREIGAGWGASALPEQGLVVRGLACEAHQATRGLHVLWQAAKQRIWNRPALMPRKIY